MILIFPSRHSRDVPKFLQNEPQNVQHFLTPIFYSEVLSSVLAFLTFSYCQEAVESSVLLQQLCTVEVGRLTRETANGTEFCPVGITLRDVDDINVGKFCEDFKIQVRYDI